jgi:hypothetical protein
MSATVPDTPSLLQAAADYLEGELLPTLPDYHRFQTRVTVNLLRLIERELRLAPAQQQAEAARLRALTGRDGTLDELNAALADDILAGHVTLTDHELRQHLQRTLRETLQIHNPAWTRDEAEPLSPRRTA